MTQEFWKSNEEIVKDIVFEFMSLYGASNTWTQEIKDLFEDEVKKRTNIED